MKKIVLTCIFALVIIGGFIAYLSTHVGDFGGKPDTDPDTTLYIGVYGSFTGVDAGAAQQELLGIKYANYKKPTVKIAGTEYTIVLKEGDNMSNVSASSASAHTLLDNNLTAIIGTYGSSALMAAATELNESTLPVIGVSSSSSDFLTSFDNYYRVNYNDKVQGSVMANFAYNKGFRSIAVGKLVGDTYSKSLADSFIAEFKRLGGETQEFTFNDSQRNFTLTAEEIMKMRVDGVFAPCSAFLGELLIRDVRKAGVTCPMLGGHTWDNITMAENLGYDGWNVFFSSPFTDENKTNALSPEFSTSFLNWVANSTERMEINGGRTYTSISSALGYDSYMALMSALENSVSLTNEELIIALDALSFSGATGDLAFSETGDNSKSTAFIKTLDYERSEIYLIETINTKKNG